VELTIREFATEFNLEIKQVQNRISYEKKKGKQLGMLKNGVRMLSDSEIQYLKGVLNVSENNAELSTEISFYQERIRTLERLLENQQILTKQAQNQSEKLQIEFTEIQTELEEEKRKGFFQRLFGK